MSVGSKIREIRKSRNMTQVELAAKVNVDSSFICQIERGSKTPNIVLSKELADALDCDIKDFID